jgi:membrane fusion protein, multidrug efflux system
MKASQVRPLILLLASLSLPECRAYAQKAHDQARKVSVATVQSKTVTVTHSYICQIESHRHIKVRAPEKGYLEGIPVREGQTVKRGDLLFQLRPLPVKDALGGETESKMVSVKAPFDGIIDRLPYQRGTLILQGETLTNLFDNSLVRVYFNVPEARYFECRSASLDGHKEDPKVELVLANGKKFDQPGKLSAIGAVFNAGSVAFRADFSNPNDLLRHGQTGRVLMSQVRNDAIVIPQRATFQVHDKWYVLVVDKDDVAHKREIVVQNEVDDLFVAKTGVSAGDKIVIGGLEWIRDGDKVNY